MSNDSYTPGRGTPRWAPVGPGFGDEAVNWADIQQWEAAPLQTYAAECDSNQRKLQSVGEALHHH